MSDLISQSRASNELLQMATEIAANLDASEYGEGFVDGYRAAARALLVLMDDRTRAIVAEMNAEAAQ